MSELNADRRKMVCRKLTDVLKRSAFGTEIDPKSFYMLLSTNFAVLYQQDVLDLEPLWGSLRSRAGEDARLPGLFLTFAESARQLGLPTRLPAAVEKLPPEEQQMALHRAFQNGNIEAEIERLPDSEVEFDTDEIPALESEYLQRIVSEAERREITRLVVHCLKTSAAGPGIDGAQLAFRIDEHFAELCDGRSFNLTPVLEGLREVTSFRDQDVFVGIIRLRKRLLEHGVELRVASLNVSEDEGRQLVADAEAAERAERRRSITAATQKVAPPPHEEAHPDAAGTGKGTKRERQLRRYGLLGLSRERWKNIRMGTALVTLLVVGVGAWMTRPDRPLNPGRFSIPLKSAEVRAGAFVGRLNDNAWYRIPTDLRPERLDMMASELRSRRLLSDAQIFDQKRRLVIRARGTDLHGSRFALLSPDGEALPPPGQPLQPGDPGTAPTEKEDSAGQ